MPEFAYPLLTRVSELYADADLGDVLLLASQHLLTPQREMFRRFMKAGLKPHNCLVVGKVYSTNAETMADLAEMDCIVAPFSFDFDPTRSFDDWFGEKLRRFIEATIGRRNLADYRKIIVLDDGGFLHLVVNDLFGHLSNLVGIEQTSSGHHKINATGISFPYVSVARSFHKLNFESPLIGRLGYERIIQHLAKRGKQDPSILVLGLGPIGTETAIQLFIMHDYDGRATDIKNADCGVSSQLLCLCGKVMGFTEAMERLGEFDVVVGCAGSPVLTENDIERLHPEVSLISMSSSDREFPSATFRKNGGGPHDDYYLGNRCLVNAGFPITFYGWPHEMPPQQIEFTVALLMASVLDEASNQPYTLDVVGEQIRSFWQPDEGADQWYAEHFS